MKEVNEGTFDVNAVLIDLEMTLALRQARQINETSAKLLVQAEEICDTLSSIEQDKSASEASQSLVKS